MRKIDGGMASAAAAMGQTSVSSSQVKNVSNSKNDNVLLFRWDEFIVYKDFEKFTTYFFRFAIKENTHTQKIDNISSSVCRMAN